VSTAGSSSVELPQPEQVSGQEKKRVNEMMPAVLLDEQRQFVFGQRPGPTPRPDQVLVEVDLCGIGGSDLHAADLPQVYRGGFVLGHEFSGRVVATGDDVSGWSAGERAAVNPNETSTGHASSAWPAARTSAIRPRWKLGWDCSPTVDSSPSSSYHRRRFGACPNGPAGSRQRGLSRRQQPCGRCGWQGAWPVGRCW
jgi:Alcohol dehydrogenase GroES-like domain